MLKSLKLLKQHPTSAQNPEKFWEKVAETAEIPKTAPKSNPKTGKILEKSS